MKKITEMFPEISADIVLNTLAQHHISIEEPDKTLFSRVNLVTGPNGAGKTRLLNALLELYNKVLDAEVLYGYFPALSCDTYPGAGDGGLRDYTLWEYRGYNKGSFHDFFREIELQHKKFIPQLLQYESGSEKGQKAAILKEISHILRKFTEKELVETTDGGQLLVREVDGTTVPLSEALEWFSPGELMLFYMSIFFSLKRDGERKWVIILDEPESHLHPKALLNFVKVLKDTFPGAMIWIATHSLFLLPEFQFENIVYLENGRVLRRRSDLYQKALAGLLGEDSENVSRFFASLPHWQYYEFITECFTNPTVVSTVNPEDEQVRIFIEALKKHEITRVLDCGGGSGRLGLSMMETTAAEWGSVTYDIYDAWPTYNGQKFKVYKQLGDTPGGYDCVIMMNFLHEIPPLEWSDWFQKIYGLMVPEGHLLFVEVEALQIGECPNDTGYLVLGPDELQILFDLEAELPKIQIGKNPKSFGVLVAWKDLLNVNSETIFRTIQHLEKRSYLELDAIRTDENRRQAEERAQNKPAATDEKKKALDARKYAFYSQQYINARLFINKIEELPENSRLPKMSPPMKKEVSPEKKEFLMALLSDVDFLMANTTLYKDTQREAIGGTFRNAVASYLMKGYVSERRLQLCRDMIGAMEAISGNKRLIGTLLQIGALLGDQVCAGRLIKEGYPMIMQ